MRYTYKTHNMDIGDRTKEKIASKLNRIAKLFPEDAMAAVKINAEKLDTVVEITIPVNNKRIVRAETKDGDLMAAVDKAVDKLESQIVKYKKRLHQKVRKNKAFQEEYDALPLVQPEEDDNGDELQIVKNKRFELRPMDAEEAVMQMELLGHNFYVFRNGQTDVVNVVYRRKDGTFGLIEPEY